MHIANNVRFAYASHAVVSSNKKEKPQRRFKTKKGLIENTTEPFVIPALGLFICTEFEAHSYVQVLRS